MRGRGCCTCGHLLPASTRPIPAAARAFGRRRCRAENAFDAFTSLFPASKALILGMDRIVSLLKLRALRKLQPLVDPLALNEDTTTEPEMFHGRNARNFAIDHIREMGL